MYDSRWRDHTLVLERAACDGGYSFEEEMELGEELSEVMILSVVILVPWGNL